MSGETEKAVSGWTTDTLRAAVDQQFRSLHDLVDERDTRYSQRFQAQQEALTAALSAAKEAVAAALLAADRAVTKAELAAEKRFESVNEFRGALSDQTNKLLPRIEAEQRFTALEEKIDRLDKAQNQQAGRGLGISSAGALTFGVFGVIAAIASVAYVVVRIATGH